MNINHNRIVQKYIRRFAHKIMRYTEKQMDIKSIFDHIEYGEYYRSQIKIDKLSDIYGHDPIITELQNKLDTTIRPIELNLKSYE